MIVTPPSAKYVVVAFEFGHGKTHDVDLAIGGGKVARKLEKGGLA